MKKFISRVIILVGASIIAPFCLQAQDVQPSRIHEIGISFNNLNSFGLRYKWGNDTTLYRITGLVLNGSYAKASPDSLGSVNSGVGFGFNIGFEKRKPIINNLSFYDGLELQTSCNYSYSNVNTYYIWNEKLFQVDGGLGIVLGLSYKVSSTIYLDVEVVPDIMYTYKTDKINQNGGGATTKTTKTRTSTFSLNLSNTVNLTLSYRF